jgi:hypothetical protein
MTSNFTINRLFEEKLHAEFHVADGVFNLPGQEQIFQHTQSMESVKSLDSWKMYATGTDSDNFFQVEYRWSFDTVNWTTWVEMDDGLSVFPNDNNSFNTWIQVKFTYNGTRQVTLNGFEIDGTRKIDPIFEPAVIKSGTPVIYTNHDTYKIFRITDFKVFLSHGDPDDLVVSFRYTQSQGRYWSEWLPLTQHNLVATKFDPIKFCNFQFAFSNKGTVDIGVYDLEMIGEFQNISAGYKTMARLGLKTQCSSSINGGEKCLPCSESNTPWNDNIERFGACGDSKFQNFNDKNMWKAQIELYEMLNDFQTAGNSWRVTYCLHDPDKKGSDPILHEHQLYNVIQMKDINIIVPDNQFPSDGVSFSGLNLDLIQSFEIHVTKNEFKRAFGVEFRPGKEDVLYLCDLNQLWEVEQMFPKRGFMNAEAYYRVMLKRYNAKSSRNLNTSPEAKTFIEGITKHTTLDDLFGIKVSDEIKQATKDSNVNIPGSTQQYTSLSTIDIRKALASTVTIKRHELYNASLTVAKYAYVLPIASRGMKLVEYKQTDNVVGKADNRSLAMWLNTETYNPEWDWTLFSNYDYDNNSGYKLNLFQGVLSFTVNNSPYSIPLIGFAENTWYCVYIGLDQKQGKLEIAVYRRQSEDGRGLSDSRLVTFHRAVFEIEPQEFSIDGEMFVGGVDTFTNKSKGTWHVTNVRLFKQCIDKSKRNIVLNENVISDSHLAILTDNAEPNLKLPNYGNL